MSWFNYKTLINLKTWGSCGVSAAMVNTAVLRRDYSSPWPSWRPAPALLLPHPPLPPPLRRWGTEHSGRRRDPVGPPADPSRPRHLRTEERARCVWGLLETQHRDMRRQQNVNRCQNRTCCVLFTGPCEVRWHSLLSCGVCNFDTTDANCTVITGLVMWIGCFEITWEQERLYLSLKEGGGGGKNFPSTLVAPLFSLRGILVCIQFLSHRQHKGLR